MVRLRSRRPRLPTVSKPQYPNRTPDGGDGGSGDCPVGPGETKEPRGFESLVSIRREFAGRHLGRAVVRLGPCIVPGRGRVVEQAERPVRGGLTDPIRVEMAGRGVDGDLRLERVRRVPPWTSLRVQRRRLESVEEPEVLREIHSPR